jgi:hypothetical protein
MRPHVRIRHVVRGSVQAQCIDACGSMCLRVCACRFRSSDGDHNNDSATPLALLASESHQAQAHANTNFSSLFQCEFHRALSLTQSCRAPPAPLSEQVVGDGAKSGRKGWSLLRVMGLRKDPGTRSSSRLGAVCVPSRQMSSTTCAHAYYIIIHARACVRIRFAHANVCTLTCAHSPRVHTHAHTQTCSRTHAHTRTHAHAQAHTHTHTHTHTGALRCRRRDATTLQRHSSCAIVAQDGQSPLWSQVVRVPGRRHVSQAHDQTVISEPQGTAPWSTVGYTARHPSAIDGETSTTVASRAQCTIRGA